MKNVLETAQSDVFFPDFPEKKREKCTFATKISAFPAPLAGLQKNFTAFLTYRFLHSCGIGRTAKAPSRSPRGRDLPSAGAASRHVAGYA